MLVLGSLPGEASLAVGRYYAHPRNQFWRLMERVTGTALADLDYDRRLQTLMDCRVGLWDSVRSAQRAGSLDTAIRSAEVADLASLVARLTKLRAVAFNGKASARIGTPQVEGTGVVCLTLPSSSPAHASMTFTQKAGEWEQLRQFLR